MTVPIWLQDGAWDSGEIDANGDRPIKSDHDANVTLFTGRSRSTANGIGSFGLDDAPPA
jgi:hypothetical protein